MPIRLVLLGLLLAGCSSSGGTSGSSASSVRLTSMTNTRYEVEMQTTASTVVSVPASAVRVWGVLPEVYAEMGLAGEVLDAAGYVYGQPETPVRRRLAGQPLSRFLDCGDRAGVSNANTYSVKIAVRTQVQAAGEASRISTEVQASARAPEGSDPWVRCGSTNELERRIEALVRQRSTTAG